MKNKKIIVSFVLVLLLNVVLICTGIFLQSKNINKDREMFYDEFTSKVFVSTVTHRETNDINEMYSMMDGERLGLDGNMHTGFELTDEKEIVADYSKVFKETISNSIFSNSISWSELSSISDMAYLETAEFAANLIVYDKGADQEFWADFPKIANLEDKAASAHEAALALHAAAIVPAMVAWPAIKDALELPDNTYKDIFTKLWNGDINKITIAAINAFMPGLGTLIYNKGGLSGLIGFLGDILDKLANIVDNIFLYGLDGLGLKLIDKIDTFVYEEEIDGTLVEVTYDFSSYVTKDEIYGVEGSKLGVLNWTPIELHKFFESVSISTDLFNHGDIHKSMTLSSAFKVNSSSYYHFTRFLGELEDEYTGIPYENYGIHQTPDGGWVVSSRKTNTITSEGEAFLYWIYDSLDYKEMLDDALTIDGVTSYDYKYISELYGTGRYLAEDFVFDDGQESIYVKGQKSDITFGNFLVLTKTYKPFLRSVNYENLVWSVAEEIYN